MSLANIFIGYQVVFVLLIIVMMWISRGSKCNGFPHFPFEDEEPPRRKQ